MPLNKLAWNSGNASFKTSGSHHGEEEKAAPGES